MEETVAEAVIGLGLLWFASSRPRTAGFLALMIAAGAGYVLQVSYSHKGASIVGKSTMKAAIFAPEIEQGLRLADVPVPDHTSSQTLVKVSRFAQILCVDRCRSS